MNLGRFTVTDLEDDNEREDYKKLTSGSLFKSHREEIQTNIQKSKSPSKASTKSDIVVLSSASAKSVTGTTSVFVSSTNNGKQEEADLSSSRAYVPSLKDSVISGYKSNSNSKTTARENSNIPSQLTVTQPTNSIPESPKKPLTSSTASLIISLRQRGNPIIKFIRNVPWEFGDIVPDYQMGKAMCALYLSLRYHQLNPAYIHERLKQLGRMYDLRVLLVQVDVKDPHHSLKELAKISILSDVSLILAFSPEEAGRYLETYKAYENKPPDLIMEKTESNFLAQFTDCVTSTRKVNKTDATTLLTTFGNFKRIAEVGEEDLSLCPGFGPQKAKRLYDVLHEPFLKAKKKKEESSKSSGTSNSKPSAASNTSQIKSPIKQFLSSETSKSAS